METTSTAPNQAQKYQLQFFGDGGAYFKILIVNFILILLTLGFYYPWARAKKLRYIFGQAALNDEHFHFSGTGKEMFKGFIKFILYFVVIGIIAGLLFKFVSPILAIPFLYIGLLAIVPLVIHGSYRYRMSRTSYRGIRFGYRGDRNEFIGNFFKWLLLTILTLGIYGFWLQMHVRRYTHQNIRYGDVEFSNDASGTDWFFLNLKGFFLTLITLGIYIFWWEKDIFNFYINHMEMTKGEQEVKCFSTATGGGVFKLEIVNFLMIVFSLGIAIPWAEIRSYKFFWGHIEMEGDINLNEIHQTEEEYKEAFGDVGMDLLDIDLT